MADRPCPARPDPGRDALAVRDDRRSSSRAATAAGLARSLAAATDDCQRAERRADEAAERRSRRTDEAANALLAHDDRHARTAGHGRPGLACTGHPRARRHPCHRDEAVAAVIARARGTDAAGEQRWAVVVVAARRRPRRPERTCSGSDCVARSAAHDARSALESRPAHASRSAGAVADRHTRDPGPMSASDLTVDPATVTASVRCVGSLAS